MDKCKICNQNSEHTHHIKEQQTADNNNIIDNHHKNINHNLVPLCEMSCHHKVHHGNLVIHGYHSTSNGIQLNFEYINNNNNNNNISSKKFNKGP